MKKRLLLLFFALLVIFPLSSCQMRSTPPYFNFRSREFRAEITGTLHGIAFGAELWLTGTGDECELYIKYLSPTSLAGICIEQEPDGTCRLSRDGIEYETDKEALAGLLLPLSLLWESDEILRVQKTAQGTELYLDNDLSIVIGDAGYPTYLESPSLTFSTVWWD